MDPRILQAEQAARKIRQALEELGCFAHITTNIRAGVEVQCTPAGELTNNERVKARGIDCRAMEEFRNLRIDIALMHPDSQNSTDDEVSR